jgi:hypothetical protein
LGAAKGGFYNDVIDAWAIGKHIKETGSIVILLFFRHAILKSIATTSTIFFHISKSYHFTPNPDMSQPENVFPPSPVVGPSLPESVSSWDFVSQEQSTALLHGIGEHPEDRRLVYRTDLEKNPWVPKSTVKDRHSMRFRISNVGNGALRELKDFWNDQFRVFSRP